MDRLEETFHYGLQASQSAMHKQLLARLKDTGLTIGQPKVLEYLREHGGANQAEIARACRIEPATLTSLLNRMEEQGMLQRHSRPDNRRSFFIFLTPLGTQLAQRVTETFEQLEREAFRGIDEARRREFLELFRQVRMNLAERDD